MKLFNKILNGTLIFWWRFLDMIGAPTSVIRGPLPDTLAKLTPADAGLEFYETNIHTMLGKCPAWVVPAESDNWVVFIHGRGGARVGVLDMLPLMHQLGYNSLVITHRNDWEAPKSPDGRDHLGADEWTDLEAAVEFITDISEEVGKIALFARSAGAMVVGQFLDLSVYASLVDRVVLDEPVLNWDAVFMAQRPVWLPKWLARLIIWGNGRRIGVDIRKLNWTTHPPMDKPPVLILHTSDDDVCPVWVSRQFARIRPGDWNVVLVEFPTGAHAGARFEEPTKYLTLVSAWLAPGRYERLAPNALQAGDEDADDEDRERVSA